MSEPRDANPAGFQISLRGYRPAEVDSYVEQLKEQVRRLSEENDQLSMELNRLRLELDHATEPRSEAQRYYEERIRALDAVVASIVREVGERRAVPSQPAARAVPATAGPDGSPRPSGDPDDDPDADDGVDVASLRGQEPAEYDERADAGDTGQDVLADWRDSEAGLQQPPSPGPAWANAYQEPSAPLDESDELRLPEPDGAALPQLDDEPRRGFWDQPDEAEDKAGELPGWDEWPRDER